MLIPLCLVDGETLSDEKHCSSRPKFNKKAFKALFFFYDSALFCQDEINF